MLGIEACQRCGGIFQENMWGSVDKWTCWLVCRHGLEPIHHFCRIHLLSWYSSPEGFIPVLE